MTFRSDNGIDFVGELTKKLMRRSQVAQAHSTTYQTHTNGLVRDKIGLWRRCWRCIVHDT